MKSKTLWSSPRTRITVLTLGGLLFALGVSAAPVGADPNWNNQSINQTEEEDQGDEYGAGAIAGQATAFNAAINPQINIQIVAVWDGTEDNCEQVASNDATINQNATAASGDASADGGYASSGNALAGNIAVAAQSNVQVIVGSCGGGVTQTASNEADIDQSAEAATGDASSDGWDSSAETGDAASFNVDTLNQHNEQVYVDTGFDTGFD